MLCFSVCLCRGVFRTHPDIVLCSEYRTYQKSLFMNRLRCISLFSHSFIAPQKRFLRTFLLNTHSISPPFLMGGQLSVPNFEKGGGSKKKSAWEGDLMFLVKKRLKNKIWVWGLNFKWWSLPVFRQTFYLEMWRHLIEICIK